MESISVIVGSHRKSCTESSNTSPKLENKKELTRVFLSKDDNLLTPASKNPTSSVNQNNLLQIPLKMETKCTSDIKQLKQTKTKELKIPESLKVRNDPSTIQSVKRSKDSKRSSGNDRSKSHSNSKSSKHKKDSKYKSHLSTSDRETISHRHRSRHRHEKSNHTPKTQAFHKRVTQSPSSRKYKQKSQSRPDSKINKSNPGRRTPKTSPTHKKSSEITLSCKKKVKVHCDKGSTSKKQEETLKSKVINSPTKDVTKSPSKQPTSNAKDNAKMWADVFTAALKYYSTSLNTEDKKEYPQEKKDTSCDTTFLVNFNISSPKLSETQRLKLPDTSQTSDANGDVLLSEINDCFSPTSSFSPCADEEKCESVVEGNNKHLPDASCEPSENNHLVQSSSVTESKNQAKPFYISQMSFWPSSLQKIETVAYCSSKKAPVCVKCLHDNAHIEEIKDPRSQNERYRAHFIAWHMCCLCFRFLNSAEKYVMCCLPEELSSKECSSNLSTDEQEAFKKTSGHGKPSENKMEAMPVSIQQQTEKFIESKTGEINVANNATKKAKSPLTSTENKDDVHPVSTFSKDVQILFTEQDTPYYYNANYCHEIAAEVVPGLLPGGKTSSTPLLASNTTKVTSEKETTLNAEDQCAEAKNIYKTTTKAVQKIQTNCTMLQDSTQSYTLSSSNRSSIDSDLCDETTSQTDKSCAETAESSDDAVNILFCHLEESRIASLSPVVDACVPHADNSCIIGQTDAITSKPNFSPLHYTDLSSDSSQETVGNFGSKENTKSYLKTSLTFSEASSTDISSPKSLRIVEESETDDNFHQASKAFTTKVTLHSETSDTLRSSESESFDYTTKDILTDSSRDFSNPDWLQQDLPDINRSRKRRKIEQNNPSCLVTAPQVVYSPICPAPNPDLCRDIEKYDKAVPFKKRKFSDLDLAEFHDKCNDVPALETDLFSPSHPVSEPNETESLLDFTEKSINPNKGNMSPNTENFDHDADGENDTSYQDLAVAGSPVITQLQIDNDIESDHEEGTFKCSYFSFKNKSYAWPYTYPSISQIEDLSDPDDSEDDVPYFDKPFVFLKRIEEDGYVPKCFVENITDHQCCLCCNKFCCSSSWVSLLR